jgi:long-chain-alcohol oxidase
VTARQRRALESICETFVDGAVDAGVPDALLALTPRADRRALLALLSVWDLGGRFSRRPRPHREASLRAWRDSAIPARRRVFHGLRRGALISYHARAAPSGDRRLRDVEPRLRPLHLATDTRLACDVCVVGSGAGGGVAAAVLAQAGLDVVVLEAGDHHEEPDFGGVELDAYRRLYYESAAPTTTDGGVGLLAGSCVGGTTVVNYTTSFRTPAPIREEWGEPFTSPGFDTSLDAVCERLGVNTDEGSPSTRDQVMARGLERLGWHVAEMPRNTRGCDQGLVCGRCGFGCPLGAKQSTLVTWLVDAHASGARIVPSTRATRVLVAGGRARSVEARTAGGAAVTVDARAIVLAAGALNTPVLLQRSGLGGGEVGKHLHLHPTTGVCGIFDEEIRPWEGTMQALYSDQHADLSGGYGLKYETAPVHPGVLAAFGPWHDAAQSRRLLERLPQLSGIGVLLRDRSEGEVRATRAGDPRVTYGLTAFDVRHIRAGVDGAARILEAAGAREIFSSHARWTAYAPAAATRRDFVGAADAVGYAAGRCTFYSFHLMGSARIGTSPRTSATKPNGETWTTRALYVLDGSSFPSASGVNPMITIEAIAHLNARGLAADLT